MPHLPARIPINEPDHLDAAAILAIARKAAVPEVSEELLGRLQARRAEMMDQLSSADRVYGVSTAMGALVDLPLAPEIRSSYQDNLMLARSVGGPPWLAAHEVRAVLAVRLRSFLNGDAAVSSRLCRRLQELIEHDVLAAIPRGSTGVAGEIVGMAHLGAVLIGRGQVVQGTVATPAAEVLRCVGLEPLHLGEKEGIAILEGVPTATALAILAANEARALHRQVMLTFAGELALSAAASDVLDPALARGDLELAAVTDALRRWIGTPQGAPSLQPPVSFRASPQVLAHLVRSLNRLDEAIERALTGVTDSPAFLGAAGAGSARFVGSAGFYGYDLATHLQALTIAIVGVAETGVARLHRLLDPAVSGLNAQLSADPGPQTGLPAVHKRAVGAAHLLRRLALPATLGPVETSAGQEDVQSFSLEAAEACRNSIDGTSEVLSCELLALHQMRCLGALLPVDAGADLVAHLDTVASLLPATAEDRLFGNDLQGIQELLAEQRRQVRAVRTEFHNG